MSATSPDELMGAWTKLDRAKKHIREAEVLFDGLAERDRYVRITKRDLQPGAKAYKISSAWRKALGEANCSLGDAVHNLRSALDHLAFALSQKYAPGLSDDERRGVFFPITHSRRAFESQANRSRIRRQLGRGVISFLRRFKPYKTSHISNKMGLWAIHQLDVIDKHRRLIALEGAVRYPVALVADGNYLISHHFQSLEDEIIIPPVRKGPQVEIEPNEAVSITIGDAGVIRFDSPVEIVQLLAEYVEEVIAAFERRFFR